MDFKNMDGSTFNNEINKSGGTFLINSKKMGELPPKALFFENGINKFAIHFLLENYDLEEKEVIAIKNYVLNLGDSLSSGIKESLIDSIKVRGNISIDSFFENDVLSVQNVVGSLSLGSIPMIHPEYKNWDFVVDLMSQDPNFLDPFSGKFNENRINFLHALLVDIDFSNIPASDTIFHRLCREINGDVSFNAVFHNKSFLIEFCNVMAGEDILISPYLVGEINIPNAFVARSLLKGIYKREKTVFEKESGLHPEPFSPTVIQDMEKDPEFRKRQLSNLENRKIKFEAEKKEFGDFGLFKLDFTHINSINVFNNLEKFLSDTEINEITEGNSLNHIPRKDIPKNLKKIQHVIYECINHKINTSWFQCPTSIYSLIKIGEILKESSLDLVLTSEFVKKLSKLKVVGVENRFENINSKRHGGDYNLKDLDKIMKISKVLTNTPDSIPYLNKNLLPGFILFFKNASKKLKTEEEIYTKIDLLTTFIEENRNLLDIENFWVDEFSKISNILEGVIFELTVSDDNYQKYKDYFHETLLKKMGPLGVDEICMLSLLNIPNENLKPYVSKEDALFVQNISRLFINEIPYSDIPKSERKNSFLDVKTVDNDGENNEMLLSSSVFRERVLNEKIQLPNSLLIKYLSELNFLDTDDIEPDGDYERAKIIERFFIDYIDVNPAHNTSSLTIPKEIQDKFIELHEKLEARSSTASIIDDYKKTKNNSIILEALLGVGSENIEKRKEILQEVAKLNKSKLCLAILKDESLNVGLKEIAEAGFNSAYFIVLLTGSNSQKYFPAMKDIPIDSPLKDLLIDEMRKPSTDVLTNFLGAFSRSKENANFAVNFLKEEAPDLLLSDKMKYIYEKYDVDLDIDCIIRGVKSLVSLSKNNSDLYVPNGLVFDKILFDSIESRYGDWANAVKDLSPEEKIVLCKYGSSFATEVCLSIHPHYCKNNPPVAQMFNVDVKELERHSATNKLTLEMPEIFTESFFKENKDLIKKIYFSNKKSNNEYVIKNFIGDVNTFNHSFPQGESSFQFNNQVESNKLLKECLFDNRNFFNFSPAYVKNKSFKNSVDGDFVLNTKTNVDKFLSLVAASDNSIVSMYNKTDEKEAFVDFCVEVLSSVSNANEEIQLYFIKKFEVFGLGNSDKNSSAFFFENVEIKDAVSRLKLKHKISQSISTSELDRDCSGDDGLEFKL